MFKHFLLPTDGSQMCGAAIQKSIQFAKETQAKVTGVHVLPEFHSLLTYELAMPEATKEEFDKDSQAQAAKFLAVIESAAKEAGVACDTAYVTSDHPYEAILKMAEDKGCDLIAMASHGRKGVRGFLLGSETQKVLAHSQVPVLVFR
jgi:nucleotide-binding universal stress UspA family protein